MGQMDTNKDIHIMLRGFIEQVDQGKWRGIYLNLNLAAEGRSFSEVNNKLHELTRSYLIDAIQEGDLDKMYPRRAPLSYYMRYYQIALSSLLPRLMLSLFPRQKERYVLSSPFSLAPNA